MLGCVPGGHADTGFPRLRLFKYRQHKCCTSALTRKSRTGCPAHAGHAGTALWPRNSDGTAKCFRPAKGRQGLEMKWLESSGHCGQGQCCFCHCRSCPQAPGMWAQQRCPRPEGLGLHSSPGTERRPQPWFLWKAARQMASQAGLCCEHRPGNGLRCGPPPALHHWAGSLITLSGTVASLDPTSNDW